ncbi:hypothetical protein GDO81_026294 [Engystomops pustulosus]|uniref:Uncharacterized protein n=1 Tax=Engystomops pustulosus TaxID=76066 RepID=A0AAV6Z0J3_ENGPU|nr:hypothetical protein GDO81_026294 [Engystomops pustulosus]
MFLHLASECYCTCVMQICQSQGAFRRSRDCEHKRARKKRHGEMSQTSLKKGGKDSGPTQEPKKVDKRQTRSPGKVGEVRNSGGS